MDKETLREIKEISKELRKEDKSLKNRLQSIIFDNNFLKEQVFPTFQYPVVPNERCGLWYCDPKIYDTTSYFKSTDGHMNQWDFSTRRLNFHLLPLLGENGGLVILDSTRRGKKIPDALSKTVPIWCAVLNYLMLEADGKQWPFEEEILFVPPSTVPESEFDRMFAKLPELVQKLKKLDIIDVKKLRKSLQIEEGHDKLLRPIWVYPGSSLLQLKHDLFSGEVIENTHWEPPSNIIPVILCTVSYQCQDGTDKRYGFTYVQGAADDHELWAENLTPQLFWENIDELGDISKSDAELKDSYNAVILRAKVQNSLDISGDISKMLEIDTITARLHLGKITSQFRITPKTVKYLNQKYSAVVLCHEAISVTEITELPRSIHIFPLPSGSKKSSRELRSHLIKINALIEEQLSRPDTAANLPILIACDSGKDISVSILLVALCKYYNLDWELQPQDSVNKTIIKKHLAKIIESLQGRNVNPSRASLNSVNSFLM
ncbi:tRNA A64-2'-O-ribosylphosphate transferase [Kluyveromyces lactis]|uniref:KLLA0D01386p n=1 Tax=Kluyveromyces lactis (strain ATCC 8585 / CBS 2359 / DSM 70799 / NBRC 1267 / NRRL Y-1140 / WM37) TaxID=284590 RepID=Q6CSF9_KLULA|nr:uncharacterized protein KLLA0_D01386g [Kluyveromyces lactis]CAH00226.1 KLLA0D01386p [Kluyveromyces lactis]|eukprot:XP_453130.1 uncharacterized protein KLLA0_D01386g [Kluyveromyces lactis]